MPTPVVAFGLGPIGRRIATCLLARPALFSIVGAVDVDPEILGEDLADLVDAGEPLNIQVARECPFAPSNGGVLVHATSSLLESVAPQILGILERGWNVISTCEELTYPWSVDSAIASSINSAAHAANVSVLASGINPGFIMDALPLTLSALCTRVDAVAVRRVVDTNMRRRQLQQKAGVGLSPQEFTRLADAGKLGHIGLSQSIYMLASRLGWSLTSVDVSLEPIIGMSPVVTPLGVIAAGAVVGQRQIGTGYVGASPRIRLHLEMAAGSVPTDEVSISGEPSIHQVIEGGVNGDVGTEAMIANLIGPVQSAPAGLLTMADLMPVACADSGGMASALPS